VKGGAKMHHISLKDRMHHMHLPHRHGMSIKMHNMTHDERFWLIVTLIVLCGLIWLSIWAGMNSGGALESTPLPPFYPY
jgi:hypothetical protein